MKLLRVALSFLLNVLGLLFVLTIGSFTALVKGVWMESDRLARLWEAEGRRGRPPLPTEYLVVRIAAFVLMLIYLAAFFWLVNWILQW